MAQENTLKALMLIQIIAALLLKGSKNRLYSMIYALQMMVYTPIFKVTIPANLIIFLTAIRKIAEFDVIESEQLKIWFGLDKLLASDELS